MRGRIHDNPDMVTFNSHPGWNMRMNRYIGNTYEFKECSYNKEWVVIIGDKSDWKFDKRWIDFEDDCVCYNCTNKNCLNCDKVE